MPLTTADFMTLVKPLIIRCKKILAVQGVFNPHLLGLGKLLSGTNYFSLRLQFWTQISLDSRGQVRMKLSCGKMLGIILLLSRECIFIALRNSCGS